MLCKKPYLSNYNIFYSFLTKLHLLLTKKKKKKFNNLPKVINYISFELILTKLNYQLTHLQIFIDPNWVGHVHYCKKSSKHYGSVSKEKLLFVLCF